MGRLLHGLPILLPALSAFAQVQEITVIGTNQRDDAMNITPGVSAASPRSAPARESGG